MRQDVQRIIDTVSAWEGISAYPHRFGGTEFRLGKVEIGHIHHDGLVDIPFTRSTHAALVAANEAQEHHILPESGWISHYLRQEKDADQAIRLYRLSYLHKRSRRSPDKGYHDELASLGFDADVMATVGSANESEDEDGGV